MIYYNNNFKRIIKSFIRAIKDFFSSFNIKTFLIIIICLHILLLFINGTQVKAAVSNVNDLEQQLIDIQKQGQDEFALFCLVPYLNNSSTWTNVIKPAVDRIVVNNYDIACSIKSASGGIINYDIYYYYRDSYTRDYTRTYTSILNNTQETLRARDYSFTHYRLSHDTTNDTISRSVLTTESTYLYMCICGYKSPLMYDFLQLVYTNDEEIDYTNLLNDINTYLDNIDTTLNDNKLILTNILSILQTISQKQDTDYTQSINNITNKVDSLNNSISQQTQQQHQDAQATQNAINNQTQQQHQDAQATQNTINQSTNSILSTEANDINMNDFGVSSPTIEGSPDLTNIFNLIYNSFMSVYEDDIYRIQFQLPSGDITYNFDIPANALRHKLPDGLIVLISVFWWFILGGAVISFIVKIIHQIVTYSNGSVDGSSGGFLSELTMTPTEFVLFNILH